MALNLSKKTVNTTGNIICTLFLLMVKEIDRKFGIFGIFYHLTSDNDHSRVVQKFVNCCLPQYYNHISALSEVNKQ